MARDKQGETKAAAPALAPPMGPAAARWLEGRLSAIAPAPVAGWAPTLCGSVDIRIGRDGVWYHEGAPIRRIALARLFSSVLRREADGGYALVTPAECLRIHVDDVPFLAVDLFHDTEVEPPAFLFVTSLGEVVRLDRDHPLRIVVGPDGGFVPYITLRHGLEACFSRSLALALAGRASEQDGRFGIASAGSFFPLTVVDPAHDA